jgi:hypothetical protein
MSAIMQCDIIPTHLTDEQKAQICGILSVGCDWHTAANFAGCSLADIRRETQHDRQFARSVRRAEAGTELGHMRIVQEASKDAKNWRASIWWLERHAPDRYGPRGAGVVTARQLKAYIGMLVDAIRKGEQSAMNSQQVCAQLIALAESVDQLMRNERMLDPEYLDGLTGESPDAVMRAEVLLSEPADADDAEHESLS